MKKEICICAAVEYDNKIWRGQRHCHCIVAQTDELSYTMTRKEMSERDITRNQGFITSENRYVDRKEGFELQIAAGIKSIREYRGEILYSEDLY